MNDTGLSVLSGISQGLEKAAQNIYNINIAKQKMKQEEDVFNLTKKQKELEIKKAEYELSPEQIQLERDKLKAETDVHTALFNLRAIQMSAEETKQKKELDTYTVGMEMVKSFLEGKTTLPKGGGAKVGPFAITGEKGAAKTSITDVFMQDAGQVGEPDKTKELDDFLSGF